MLVCYLLIEHFFKLLTSACLQYEDREHLNGNSPNLGLAPNAKKCWLIIKPGKEESARVLFDKTAINISERGQKHLVAALGSSAFYGRIRWWSGK